jgi:SAM-dependent methyltransferase
MPHDDRCAACGAAGLTPHLRVAGEVSECSMVPTSNRFGTALGDIVRCPSCGHMQIDRFPPSTELEHAYSRAASSGYLAEQAGQRETARRVLREVERFVVPARLADLGCWTGFLLAEARERGWTPLGIEPSAFAASFARERMGLDVRERALSQAELDPGAFAAVVMGDVIEHLPDPGTALDLAAAALAPAGVLCLMLPDAGSRLARILGRRWWSVLPTHVQYFTRASLLCLLGRHGFVAQHVATQPKAFSLGYYLGRLGGYSPATARGLTAAARAAGVADRMWAPDFGDRMLVIAHRPAV